VRIRSSNYSTSNPFFVQREKKQRKNGGNLKDSFLRFHENFKNSLKTAVLSSNQKENSEFIFKNF